MAAWSEVLCDEAFLAIKQLFVCGSEETDNQKLMGLAPDPVQGLDLESLCLILRTAHTVAKKQSEKFSGLYHFNSGSAVVLASPFDIY
ncbi:unnamed protein product [Gongylonema pulchrum]|uniref:HECT domain-containing protein n=1 Tax=Gongylonema pulchrum TaxID=637853 RepID=A0A183EZY7_9BILA|nr:unnamed protein product [Gongylonema pulchrum]